MAKTRVPAVEGLFTTDDPPHLIGGKSPGRENYCFPKHLGGTDPTVPAATTDSGALGANMEEVLLSRTGTVWSFTTSSYAPPPPYVVATEPYEPIVIAAVQLEKEQMVVLGQMADGVSIDDLTLGTPVELIIDTLYEDDENEYLTWKWQLSTTEGTPS